jgi:hypothetical protein
MRFVGLALLSLTTLFAQVAAVPPQDALPLAIAEGPLRYPWTTTAATTAVTLRLDPGMPSAIEIIRLGRAVDDRSWHLAETVHATSSEGELALKGPIGVDTLLLIRAAGHPGYILDGPFRWPSQAATYFVRTEWRKTIRGNSTGSHASLTWVSADDGAVRGPACEWVGKTTWECVGVPLNARGVVVMNMTGEVRCGIPGGVLSPSGVETTRTRATAWGRLVVAQTGVTSRSTERVRIAAKRLQIPRARPLTTRVDVVPDSRVQIDTIAEGVAWISGPEVPDDGWIEFGAHDHASERLDIREVTEGPPDLPLRVQLQPAATVSGRVRDAANSPASDAVVTLYRFLFGDRDRDKKPPLRISVAETQADSGGAFHFDDLAIEPYEVVAMHPVFGRGVRRVTPDGREIDIAMRSAAQAVGRVLKDGVAAAAVRVVVVPDLAQFAAADDITELRGGEAQTDEDGRFAVTLASRGSSELRIGDEGAGVKRLSLGAAERQAGVIDVGDIELNAGASVAFVFEGAGSCEILLTGPAGRTGMSVVRSSRVGPAVFQAVVPEPGRWHTVAVCGTRERAVLPAWLDLSPSARDVTIRLTWAQ